MNKSASFWLRLFGYMSAFSLVKLVLLFIDDDPLVFDHSRALKIALVAAASITIFLLLRKFSKPGSKSF